LTTATNPHLCLAELPAVDVVVLPLQ
jgi:hypothetical protein